MSCSSHLDLHPALYTPGAVVAAAAVAPDDPLAPGSGMARPRLLAAHSGAGSRRCLSAVKAPSRRTIISTSLGTSFPSETPTATTATSLASLTSLQQQQSHHHPAGQSEAQPQPHPVSTSITTAAATSTTPTTCEALDPLGLALALDDRVLGSIQSTHRLVQRGTDRPTADPDLSLRLRGDTRATAATAAADADAASPSSASRPGCLLAAATSSPSRANSGPSPNTSPEYPGSRTLALDRPTGRAAHAGLAGASFPSSSAPRVLMPRPPPTPTSDAAHWEDRDVHPGASDGCCRHCCCCCRAPSASDGSLALPHCRQRQQQQQHWGPLASKGGDEVGVGAGLGAEPSASASAPPAMVGPGGSGPGDPHYTSAAGGSTRQQSAPGPGLGLGAGDQLLKPPATAPATPAPASASRGSPEQPPTQPCRQGQCQAAAAAPDAGAASSSSQHRQDQRHQEAAWAAVGWGHSAAQAPPGLGKGHWGVQLPQEAAGPNPAMAAAAAAAGLSAGPAAATAAAAASAAALGSNSAHQLPPAPAPRAPRQPRAQAPPQRRLPSPIPIPGGRGAGLDLYPDSDPGPLGLAPPSRCASSNACAAASSPRPPAASSPPAPVAELSTQGEPPGGAPGRWHPSSSLNPHHRLSSPAAPPGPSQSAPAPVSPAEPGQGQRQYQSQRQWQGTQEPLAGTRACGPDCGHRTVPALGGGGGGGCITRGRVADSASQLAGAVWPSATLVPSAEEEAGGSSRSGSLPGRFVTGKPVAVPSGTYYFSPPTTQRSVVSSLNGGGLAAAIAAERWRSAPSSPSPSGTLLANTCGGPGPGEGEGEGAPPPHNQCHGPYGVSPSCSHNGTSKWRQVAAKAASNKAAAVAAAAAAATTAAAAGGATAASPAAAAPGAGTASRRAGGGAGGTQLAVVSSGPQSVESGLPLPLPPALPAEQPRSPVATAASLGPSSASVPVLVPAGRASFGAGPCSGRDDRGLSSGGPDADASRGAVGGPRDYPGFPSPAAPSASSSPCPPPPAPPAPPVPPAPPLGSPVALRLISCTLRASELKRSPGCRAGRVLTPEELGRRLLAEAGGGGGAATKLLLTRAAGGSADLPPPASKPPLRGAFPPIAEDEAPPQTQTQERERDQRRAATAAAGTGPGGGRAAAAAAHAARAAAGGGDGGGGGYDGGAGSRALRLRGAPAACGCIVM